MHMTPNKYVTAGTIVVSLGALLTVRSAQTLDVPSICAFHSGVCDIALHYNLNQGRGSTGINSFGATANIVGLTSATST